MLAIWAPCTLKLRRWNWQTVRLAVHTYPSRFSLKTLSKPEEFEKKISVGVAFQCGQKSFWKLEELFQRDVVTTSTQFPAARVYLKYKFKLNGCWIFFLFLRRRVDRNHLIRFRGKTSFSNSSLAVWTGSYINQNTKMKLRTEYTDQFI